MPHNTHASFDTDLIQFRLADHSESRASVGSNSARLADPGTNRLRDACLHITMALVLVGLMMAGIALRVLAFVPF
jgi:hypothetical protein